MSDFINKYVSGPVQKIGSFFSRTYSNKAPEKIVETIIKHEYEKTIPLGYQSLTRTSKILLRVSAISGLTAVLLSAYGSHVFSKRYDTSKDMRDLYLTAQYYHLVHSVAMLSLPLVKRPKIVS